MRAVVWTGVGKLEEQGRPVPEVGHGEVLIRVRAAGFCSTDLHVIRGDVKFVDPPLILGHEFAGEVADVGEDVRGFSPGDRVAVESVVGCGRCFYCRKGWKNLCDEGKEFGQTIDGGWREYIGVPAENLYKLPSTVSFREGALMEMLNGPMSAIRKGQVEIGDTVAILGPGPAGLLLVQLAKLKGATVILSGTRDNRLDVGRALGADYTVNIRREDLATRVREITEGRMADVAMEAAGTPEAVRQTIEIVRKKGRVVLYGIYGRPIPDFPADDVVIKDIEVIGSREAPDLWDLGIRLVASGKIKIQPIITHTLPLWEAERAYHIVDRREGGLIKLVFTVD
ncbi:MAG: zinc-dependent alcohol dehydrogenase [bacterium]